MDVMRGRETGSGLNPNAPLFVPQAYKAVEEFSDQWWQLVESSAWFRDYWLRQSFHHDHRRKQVQQKQQKKGEAAHESFDAVLPDADVLFHGYQPDEAEKEYWCSRGRWNLGGQVVVAADVTNRRWPETWRYGE